MLFSIARVLMGLSALLLAACVSVVPPGAGSPGATSPVGTVGREPTATPVVLPSPAIATPGPASTVAGAQPLLPDPAADFTTGDTARLSGGEFVGDQADLTVEEAVRLSVEGDKAMYAFLVRIVGLDDASFHYNALNFQLIDDQTFQYNALIGRQQPELDFGDLAPQQQVRGWLTFEASSTTATVALEYAPISAIESATFDFLVP